MDEDNAIFERNLSGFILSVLHAACSETESDAVSVQQALDTDTASEEEREAFFGNARTKEIERLTATMTEQNAEAENTETASEEERNAFFGNARTKEFERLTATMKEQNNEAENTETASEEEIIAFFGNARTKEFDRLTATMKEQNTRAENTETASEEERIAFFGDARTKEFDRLTATTNKQNAEAENTETESEEETIAFFGEARRKELDRLTATLNTQVDEVMSALNTQVYKVDNQNIQAKPKIITQEISYNQVETEALTEETASEKDRVAFFQSVRDAERQKLVEAFEREKKWKEEREERREKKIQEQIRKMFEDFHSPAVCPLSASCEPGGSKEQYHLYPSSSNTEYNIMLKSSVSKLHERVKAFTEEQKDLQRKLELSHAIKHRADTDENKENRHNSIRARSDAEILKADRTNDVKKTGSVRRFVSRIFKRSKSTTADLSAKQIDPEELKLDLTFLNDKKEDDHEHDEDEDQLDTARTSNSEWFTLSDIEEPPRPRLKPFFTPLKETHDATKSKSTSHKAAESVNTLLLNEPNKPVRKHSDSTNASPLSRFHRLSKWFKRLCCCCCSQNTEDRDTVCS
ncbi:trichohyalin-like [Mytilus trossulus]|uniref:trichohyalin-like n=1 Tax=Mytilus trossulus TaxID=6551 RepID=UPI0030078BC8